MNPNLTDKRSLVNVRAIQEVITPKQTRWVPTSLMHADGLTKLSSNLRETLLRWLQTPTATLTDGSSKSDGSKKNRPVKNPDMSHAVDPSSWADTRCHSVSSPRDPWAFASCKKVLSALLRPAPDLDKTDSKCKSQRWGYNCSMEKTIWLYSYIVLTQSVQCIQ